jgi:hypothetical protein
MKDFPVPRRIWESFVAWCQFSEEDESDTAFLLGRFSTFDVLDPDQPPLLDRVGVLARELQVLQTQRDAGLISEEDALLEHAKGLMGLLEDVFPGLHH